MGDATAMQKAFTVPEIKPLDQYDLKRAKICASLGWLLAKSYGGAAKVPADLQDPFYCDQYEQEHVKPPVMRLLQSLDLYCSVYGLQLGAAAPKDCTALLQLLAKSGISPTDQDVPVTETQLQQTPSIMSAHLAMIDALMIAGAIATVNQVKMPVEVELLGNGAAWENAVLYWINRLNQKLRESTEGEPVQRSAPCTDLQPVQPSCPTRWYWKLVPIRYRKDKVLPKQTPTFPLVTSVKDLSNGCAIASVIHHYCPSQLRLEDVCLKDTMSVADSLYNLQLIRDFCDSCLKSSCPLALEDLLYTPQTLRVNIMTFMAELLGWFEVQKPEFVQPGEHVDLSDPSGLIDCTTPTSGNSNSSSPSFIFKQPFLSGSSPISPVPGSLTQSTSMSHVEGAGRTWAKKQISRPLSAVSFSIPFGLDSDVDIVMGNPVGTMMRSVSSDSLGTAVPAMTRTPFSPPEDLSHLLSERPASPYKGNRGSHRKRAVDHAMTEEAIQIIPSNGKLEQRLRPEGAPAGFYLHSPDDVGDPVRLSSSAPSRSGMLSRLCSDSRIQDQHSWRNLEGSRDDSSILRVGSVDSDASEELPKAQSTPATPANRPFNREDGGVKLTSFAERKKKLTPETPTGQSPPPQMTTWTKKVDESPSKSSALNTEMSDLGARLEEKRKTIEAQKQRIEAIFVKHRQRLGNSAFQQLQKQQGEVPAVEGNVSDHPQVVTEQRLPGAGGEDTEIKLPPKLEKQVTFSLDPLAQEKEGNGAEKEAVPLGDAVSKLSAALSTLQNDMRRLSEQQKQLMSRKGSPATPAWVIPASPSSARRSRESTVTHLSSAASSPSPSRKSPRHASPSPSPKPQTSTRRKSSTGSKSPKHQPNNSRPVDLKFPTLTRVLTPQQNVDSLPHLRRVSPSQCQVQTCSSFTIGAPLSQLPVVDNSSETGSSEDHTIFSMDLEDSVMQPSASRELPGSSSGAPSECSLESDVTIGFGISNSNLLEIPLSSLERSGEEDELCVFSNNPSELELKGGIGFFFKEEETRPENEMVQRRAALLEKQQKRAEEVKRRRQELEQEKEARPSSFEEPRCRWLEERPVFSSTPPSDSVLLRRGHFTRQEYERRHQLKLMENLDKVLRQKTNTARSTKKQRPKTEFRDDSGLSRSPAKGFMGSKLSKVYSHSSLNLSSVANESGNGSSSPSAAKSNSRAQSPSRVMSPSKLANQNGEKDWENGSGASSPASIPEYTGPKLFKEPSFKSNKFIIHNALSRCCLAGKVNELQKKKIVEEMEKSTANHFLILFRDSNCQFRAVYTMNPEKEELVRLTGKGPRVVDASMVQSIYKYNSDRKQFAAIPSKTMSMSVDAFTIPGHLWHSKKPSTPKKASTPK